MPVTKGQSLVHIPTPKPKFRDRVKTRVNQFGRDASSGARKVADRVKNIKTQDISDFINSAKEQYPKLKKLSAAKLSILKKYNNNFIMASIVGGALAGKKVEDQIISLKEDYKKRLMDIKDIASLKKEIYLTRKRIAKAIDLTNKMRNDRNQLKNLPKAESALQELRKYLRSLEDSLLGYERYASVAQEGFMNRSGYPLHEMNPIKKGYYATNAQGRMVRFTNKDNFKKAMKTGKYKSSAKQSFKSSVVGGAAKGAFVGGGAGYKIGSVLGKGGGIGGAIGGGLAGGITGAGLGAATNLAARGAIRAASPMARATANAVIKSNNKRRNKDPNLKIRDNSSKK